MIGDLHTPAGRRPNEGTGISLEFDLINCGDTAL